jgi:hypothetical protein
MPETFTVTASAARTFRLTPQLRWGKRLIVNARGEGTGIAHDRLQQAWQCVETGELDWRDVERE